MDNRKTQETSFQMYRVGALLITVLYMASLPLREMFAPWEYEFSMLLHGLIPHYPDMVVLLRLPSALATLVSGLLIFYWAKQAGFKHPGGIALCYLLLPPVFWLGTAATAIPVFVLGCVAAAYGLSMMTKSRSFGNRLKGLVLSLPGVLLAAMIVKSPFVGKMCYFMLLCPVVAVLGGMLYEKCEKLNKDKLKVFLDRVSFLCSGVLLAIAVLVLLPAVLRHFKVDFPEKAALYQSGERIFRPVLVLLIPVLWFHLLRHTEKLKAKIAYFGVSIGFLIFMLPLVLPWSVMKNLTPGTAFQRLSREFANRNIAFAADHPSAAVIAAICKKKVKTIGNAPGDITPEKLEKFIEENLEKSDVVIAWTSRNLSGFCPRKPGMRRYVSGKYTLCHYFARSSK